MAGDDAPSDPAQETAAESAPVADQEERTGRLLLVVFWVWAALLLVATIAQLFGLDGILDVLDVKRWFA